MSNVLAGVGITMSFTPEVILRVSFHSNAPLELIIDISQLLSVSEITVNLISFLAGLGDGGYI